jgi:hypothetical protein
VIEHLLTKCEAPSSICSAAQINSKPHKKTSVFLETGLVTSRWGPVSERGHQEAMSSGCGGWSHFVTGSYNIVQAGLKLPVLLYQPPMC